jgi:hypothetical protein
MLQRYEAPRFLFLLVILPACFICWMIFKYSVDLPFSDQWEYVPLFVKHAHGELAFSDLFAQLNEYRQFFPNLIFVHLGAITGWDVRYEMFISFLLACMISYNIYLLGKKTVQGANRARWLAFLLSNIIIFSPVQYENWLMGQQLIYFIPIFSLTTGLVVAYSNLSIGKKFILCASLSVLSTFSSANGLLCWLLLLPALLSTETAFKFRRVRFWTAAWVLCAAFCAALYFYGFQRSSYMALPTEPLAKSAQALIYFLAFLGAPLTGNNRYLLPLAALIGLTLVSTFLAACFYYMKSQAEPALRQRLIGWLMISAYSVLTAALVTFGRLSIGISQSLGSRYTTFSLYLIVALIHLIVIAKVAPEKKPSRFARFLAPRLLSVAIAALITLHLLASLVTVRLTYVLRTRLLQAKACVLLINLVGSKCLTQGVIALPSSIVERANALDELGFLRPRLIKSRNVQELADDAKPGTGYGAFALLKREKDIFFAAGQAMLPYRGEPSDAVLLTYRNDQDQPVFFALAEMNYQGDVVQRMLNKDPNYAFSWQLSFSLSDLPSGATELSAWAFDANTGRAFKLEGTHRLQ